MNKIKIISKKKNDLNLLELTGEFIHKEDEKENKIINKFGTYKKGTIVFKMLFNGQYTVNKCNGLQRAKSLIESLLYIFPNKNAVKTIEYWPNEIPV